MKKLLGTIPLFIFILNTGCNNNEVKPDVPQTPLLSYSVANTLPHDISFFTEGLEFYKGNIIESTGLEGKSKLIQYDPANGKVSKQINLDSVNFGEGITIFRDTVYQLTYTQGIVHVYTATDFKKVKQLPYTNGQGWGLTHDSTHLIASNGSNKLAYYEPQTFKLIKEVEVKENGLPAVNVNELEYINGFIYANQWQYNTILKIDPSTGNVVAKMDLTDLVNRVKAKKPDADFLNGIAFNPLTKKVYVTGKYWPELYEIQFSF